MFSLGSVAVRTKYLKALGVIVVDQPASEIGESIFPPMLVAVIVDVVYFQEIIAVLPAARTLELALGVVLED